MSDKNLEEIATRTLERQDRLSDKAKRIRKVREGKSIDQLIDEASEKGEELNQDRYTLGEAVEEVNRRLDSIDEPGLDEKIRGAQEKSRSIADYVI